MEAWAHKINLTTPISIEVYQLFGHVFVCLGFSLPTILIFAIGIVRTVLYFGIVRTVLYFGIVRTVLYFGIVRTVWYFGIVRTVWYFILFFVLFWNFNRNMYTVELVLSAT